MHCEFLYREHRKPRWISTPNQKHLFVKHLLDHNLYIEYIFISMAKQWNQEQNSAKRKLGKHQRVRRRKIRRSGGLFLCWLQSFARRCSLKFQSWVQRIDKVLCTHSIKLSSLHCLRTNKSSSIGGRWSKCIVLPMLLRSRKKERKKEEERKEKNEWWWKAPRFL